MPILKIIKKERERESRPRQLISEREMVEASYLLEKKFKHQGVHFFNMYISILSKVVSL